MHLKRRIPVAILGATGSVGQKFVSLLAEHPWFHVVALTASERSAGKVYGQTVRWVQESPLPGDLAQMVLQPSTPPLDVRLVFSALDAGVAGDIETHFAQEGYVVVSNARNHRMEPDVPLLVPEVNPDHLALVGRQPYGHGAIITNPNCSTIGLVLPLKPLHERFGLKQIHVVTMQAVSGAGLPGLSSMEISDNVIPYIHGEEAKMESESKKILGTLKGGQVELADFDISAQCNRVHVLDGHTECVSIALHESVTDQQILEAWSAFEPEPQGRLLPSAPKSAIEYFDEPMHPQPRLHRNLGAGMTVSVGRLRPCPVLDWKFVVLSHNTVRGAAGGSILAAELATARGLLDRSDGGSA